jgi:hypothetical protein
VPERQLRLFEQHPKPLLERFGKNFFRQIPRTPGVYLMHGETGRALYVGQSKNLRSRLNSYKNAHPDHVSRKTIRLVHQVRSISWEECGMPEKARLRENELLRTLRPKFNRMNTFPKAHCFIGLRCFPEMMLFSLTRQEVSGADYFGAFKSGAAFGYQALLRLLWSALYAPENFTSYPRPLLLDRPPALFELHLPQQARHSALELTRHLGEFFRGTSCQLRNWLESRLKGGASTFFQQMQAMDLESIQRFYDYGPRRNKALVEHHQLSEGLILQEQLDDLLVTDLWQNLRPVLYPPEPATP